MGIHDRDWYRDSGRQREQRERASSSLWPSTRRGANASSGVAAAWFWGALIVLGALLAKFMLDARGDLPFPPSGQAHWYADLPDQTVAPLTLLAPAGASVQYVVRLDDWETLRPIVLIPVRGGEMAQVSVPLGRYRMTMTKGIGWRGPGALFRYTTSSKEAVHPVEFYAVDNGIVGQTIRLETLAGNMETQPARR